MGELRGLPHKFGQILSLGELEIEYSAFASLTDAAKPVPAKQSFGWIARELGKPIDQVFRHLDSHAAAASLGQVHRGQLLDGRQVAVKIQYPDVGATLDTDLALLRWLSAPLSARRSGFDLPEYRAELRRGLVEELDYGKEAAVLARFAQRAAEVPHLVTPVPLMAWCTPRLLTMTWVEGERIEAARAWPTEAKREAALALLRFFLRGCFVWGELHADPHAGNLRFHRHDGQVEVGVLDFGCVLALPTVERAGLRRLIEHGRAMSAAELLETYAALGFNRTLLEPMQARLPRVTTILFEPFLTPGPYDVSAWRLSDRLAEALEDDRWNFRFAGPATLLYLIRAFQGIVAYVSALDAALDWHAAFRELPLAAETSPAVPASSSFNSSTQSVTDPMGATLLRLCVTRNGETTVQLSFPAGATVNLPYLVPQELAPQLQARGIDLEQLAQKAVAGGLRPGELFTLDEPSRTVRVWLE